MSARGLSIGCRLDPQTSQQTVRSTSPQLRIGVPLKVMIQHASLSFFCDGEMPLKPSDESTASGGSDRPDVAIRDAVLADPKTGWPRFWVEYGGLIRGRVGRFSLSPEDSSDALQEISLRLVKEDFRVLRGWDPSRCSLAGYLTVVASSVCLDFVRSAFHSYTRRRVNVESDETKGDDFLSRIEDGELSPHERLLRLEIEDKVFDTIQQWSDEGNLKEEDRLLLDSKLRGIRSKEIAKILGISEQNVNTRFLRLKKALRERLAGAGVEASDADP